jgi:hypothetical protein
MDLVSLYALRALPASEMADAEARIAACADCRGELEALRPVIGAFAAWPVDVLRPPASLWDRLAGRITSESGGEPMPLPAEQRDEPAWEAVAPGISVNLLATDAGTDRISMLVRLAPGAAYPPHRHAGVEELYLLHGELLIDGRRLQPGDYHRAEAGTGDQRVWSETGCTCVLLTSLRDVLR